MICTITIYSFDKSTKEIWNALQKKCDIEEVGTKKYAVNQYQKYQIIDDKSIKAQPHKLQKIAHEILFERYVPR